MTFSDHPYTFTLEIFQERKLWAQLQSNLNWQEAKINIDTGESILETLSSRGINKH